MLKVIELFGGIGACTQALKRLNIDFEVVDYVEIDKYAVKSYNAMNGTNFEPQDISTWDKDLKCDLIMHGSPCQDFSIAGKNAGGDKDTGTRSSLMYETLRIVEKVRPKYVIWENVKNLLSYKHKHNFENYLTQMSNLGYSNHYMVMNAKDYGVPQNRQRVFTVSILGNEKFIFPKPIKSNLRIRDIMDENVEEHYYLTDKQLAKLDTEKIISDANSVTDSFTPVRLAGLYDGKSRHQAGSIYSINGIAATLDTMNGGNREPIVVHNNRIRRLTPKECFRLMDFDVEAFGKIKDVSNSQLYKQAGNSIVVACLYYIFQELLKKESK